ncbi:MAG: glycosyltransferase family 8 protein [Roseburia sp.]|nr:glycosyltransferase family 8 protein [Roseburia sp.]MCM1098434.1 glycosyltransferase family 8 protein [Ruminococcus flavefaciens]
MEKWNGAGGEIPVFFAVDDGYCPFLAVALQSLIDNSSEENRYRIKILNTDISAGNKRRIARYERSNIDIEFVDLNYYIQKVKDKLYTRDYYTKTTYFRLFLPNLYPQYDKVLYLDSDIVILDDIAKLYRIDMGNNLVAAAPDDVIQFNEVFQVYAEKVVGVADYRRYFNAGVLLMNLHEMRKFRFQEKFLYSLDRVTFAVAQDQDYLNRLCKGRVKLIDRVWDRMPIEDPRIRAEEVKLIHYNLAFKPWHFEDILYKEFFWMYARETEYFDQIKDIRENYTEADRFRDNQSQDRLMRLAKREADCVGDDRRFRR